MQVEQTEQARPHRAEQETLSRDVAFNAQPAARDVRMPEMPGERGSR